MKDNFIKVLLSAGLLSFIASMFGFIYNNYQEQQLESKKFENRILEQILALPPGEKKEIYVTEVFASGLLDSSVYNMTLLLDTGQYISGKYAGRTASSMNRGIIGAIIEFNKREGRVPKNLTELSSKIYMKHTLAKLTCDIYYYSYNEGNGFNLRFCGPDEIIHTEDDKIYRFREGVIEYYNLKERKWEYITKL